MTEGNFVTDMRLEDSDEVLQLPIVKNRLKKLLSSAVKKLAILGAPIIPSSDDTLEQFLQAAGKFFGKDPERWEPMGDPKVEVTEADGRRYIKSTGMYRGTELHLFVEEPFYDERLPAREDRPDLTFSEKLKAVTTNQQWQAIMADQPWTASKRRLMLAAYLHAKLEADDGELAAEGCHGFWELSISKDNHSDVRTDRLAALLGKLNSSNLNVGMTAAAAVWGLAMTGTMRRGMAELNVVQLLLQALKRTLKLTPIPDEEMLTDPPAGTVSETQRARYQLHLLGALAVLLVDRCCRRPYLATEGDFATLIQLCHAMPGYAPRDEQVRRETAAKILTSLIQRDGDARHALVANGALKHVLGLLNPSGPGSNMIQFCMASLLATMVLDDEAMDLIKERGEAPLLFEACIVLLTSTLDKLHAELDRRTGGYYQPGDTPEYDLYLGVRLGEACSQAMWGSAHYCVQMEPLQVKMAHVVELGKMGRDCVATDQLPLSRICHCITATLATLASHAGAADLIMTCPGDVALSTLMLLVEVFETEVFERAGHVKASACAAIAFLACHPVGAQGDECMYGPYRVKLLEAGAFGALLRAALTSVLDPECDMIVQQAAAIGVMFLSTMAGALPPPELAMYAALLMDSDNSEMIEYLMAGMWILLRNSENRKALGSSFSPNPATGMVKNMMHKMNDAITLHDVHDQAQEQAAFVKQKMDKMQEAKGSGTAAAEVAMQSPPSSSAAVTAATSAAPSHTGSRSMSPDASAVALDAAEPIAADVTDEQHGELMPEEGAEGAEPQVLSLGPEPAAEAEGSHTLAGLAAGQGLSTAGLGASDGSRGPDGYNQPRGGGEEGGVPHAPKPSAQKAMAMDMAGQAKLNKLEKQFSKQLKDNWGLETLVTVGESWLPAMLEQDEMNQATDVPVLKLFEFLVASICLFMIEDSPVHEARELDLYKLSAPRTGRGPHDHKTWWTVNARAPEPEALVDTQMERALTILAHIVSMRLLAAWKSVQLGVLTLWNACAQSPGMERHVVERGVGPRLLSIVNNTAWPPSLRDTAGGCLQFFMERYTNLGYMPPTGLPEGCPWPHGTAPTQGLVPALLGYITLINSRIPLLEQRGCHGLARVCYAAPYGATPEGSKEFLRDAKAASALLGAIDALVLLIKRVNKRYQDLVSGAKGNRPSPNKQHKPVGAAGQTSSPEDDSAQFERNMNNLEAQQELYFVALAALANISVLKAAQPLLARKGLQLLLGSSTFLYSRAAAAGEGANERETKLLHLLSGILQNLALHPANRTLLYRAELHGTVSMDKVIEEATDMSEDLRATVATLPPLASMTGSRGSPRTDILPSLTQRPSPTAHPCSSPSGGGGRKTAANRAVRLSPNGAVLNHSVDATLAGGVRPKVIFPPIVDHKEDVWGGRGGSAPASAQQSGGSGAGGRRVSDIRADPHRGALVSPSKGEGSEGATSLPGTGPLPNAGGNQGDGEQTDSKTRFLSWLDNTFAGDGASEMQGHARDGSMGVDGAGKRTHRKAMWDAQGDWLEDEPESSKVLSRLLCRPLSHLWTDSPEMRGKHGQRRWEPQVSEYREVAPEGEGAAPLSLQRPAQRLLTTALPADDYGLMAAATQMLTGAKFDAVSASQSLGEFELQRPSTPDRADGRVALTVLQPHPEVVLAARSQADALQEAVAEAASAGRPIDLDELKGQVASNQAAAAAAKAVPLKVVMGPQRPRQVISFADRILINDDPSRPTLTMFEHVDGSRVCRDMFPAYQLPNGKMTYMYYNSGVSVDEIAVDAVVPPPRPSTVPQALQQSMPLADVLNLIAKPPGSAPPFIPYKPVPYLVPLPTHHTLAVKRPDLLTAPAFGDLREDNLQLVMQAKKIMKAQTTTRVEAVETLQVEVREPWTLPMSIFKPRAKECDAKNFWDTEQSLEKMFERDWQRACGKEKFTSMLAREHKADSKSAKDDKGMLAEVHNVLLEYYQLWYSAFMYFAAVGSSDPYHMALNSYTSFLDECAIADPDSQFIKRSDCDTIFIVCNFQPDKKSPEAAVNLENAMMRYEFLESLVRAAIAKYGRGQATEGVAESVRMLLELNLLPNLPPPARHVPNEWRKSRLYCEEVDLLLKRHQVLLKALYSRYRLKPPGGGLRTKSVRLEGWLQLMTDTQLIDAQFTLQDACMAFIWSRMHCIDEVKDYQRYTCMTFTDFLEGLGRVADMKHLPSDVDLEAAGYHNVLEWAIDQERTDTGAGDRVDDGQMDIFRPRDSSFFFAEKNRPLYAKLELLLDLMFRRLHQDPGNADQLNQFSYEVLLKMIKKVDKDLGP